MKNIENLYIKYQNERNKKGTLHNTDHLTLDEIERFSKDFNLIKITTNSNLDELRNKSLSNNKDLIIVSRLVNGKEEIILLTKTKTIKLNKLTSNNKTYYDDITIREFNPKYNTFLNHSLNITNIDKDLVEYECMSERRRYEHNDSNSWLSLKDNNSKYTKSDNIFRVRIFNSDLYRQLNHFLKPTLTNMFRYGRRVFKYDLNTVNDNINCKYNSLTLKEMKTFLNKLKNYQREGYCSTDEKEQMKVLTKEISARRYTN